MSFAMFWTYLAMSCIVGSLVATLYVGYRLERTKLELEDCQNGRDNQ